MLYATKSNVFMASFSCITYTPSPRKKMHPRPFLFCFFLDYHTPGDVSMAVFALFFLWITTSTQHTIYTPGNVSTTVFALFFPGLPYWHGRFCVVFSLDYLIDTVHYPHPGNVSTAVFLCITCFFPGLPHRQCTPPTPQAMYPPAHYLRHKQCIHGRFCLVFSLDYLIDTVHYPHPGNVSTAVFLCITCFFPGLPHRQCTLSTPQAMYPRPFLPCFPRYYHIDTARYLHPRRCIHGRFCLVFPWITTWTQYTIYTPGNVSTAVFALFFLRLPHRHSTLSTPQAMYPWPFLPCFPLDYLIDTVRYLHPRQCIHGRFCLVFPLDYHIDTAHYLRPKQCIHGRFCLVFSLDYLIDTVHYPHPGNVSTPFFFVSLVFSLGYHIDTAHYPHPRQCIHGRFCLCLLSRLHV